MATLIFKGDREAYSPSLRRTLQPGDKVEGIDARLAMQMARDSSGKWELAEFEPDAFAEEISDADLADALDHANEKEE